VRLDYISRKKYDEEKTRLVAVIYRQVDEMDHLEDEIADLVSKVVHLVPPKAEPDKESVTKEEYDELVKARCIHCGGVHLMACPRVKRIRFSPGGQTPAEVEFWADGEWPKDRVKWLEEITVEVPSS
jgi:hypothetical protein